MTKLTVAALQLALNAEDEHGTGGQAFYGHSFICDEWGDMLAEYGAGETGALVTTLDLAAAASTSRGRPKR